MIDPRSRRRVETVPVKPSVKRDVSNGELLAQFERAVQGRLAPAVITKYKASVQDAFNYFRTPEGVEVPVRSWSKETVWEYAHFVENNYCSFYKLLPQQHASLAACGKRVWTGALPTTIASQNHCGGCSLFKRPNIRARLHALAKFYKYLARVGAVQVNFMSDIVSEHYEEMPREDEGAEKRRNPTVEEMVKLVNGTAHPARRAFYASSAKWSFRPNEMLMLDRYASFGLEDPTGKIAPGFDEGFRMHSKLASFDQAGDLVYLPKTKGGTDKRKGNRWMVIDSELRPILEQYFGWWEKTVKRDASGKATTSAMWLNEHGEALLQKRLYPRYFTLDCERLGLMKAGDRMMSVRRWTGHCQRHFGEQIRQLHNVPSDWNNHFRGDAFKDARGDYYKPTPDHIRQKYHELIPLLGFQPLPDAPRLRRGTQSEAETHRAVLQAEIARVLGVQEPRVEVNSSCIQSADEAFVVPNRVAPSLLFALRLSRPGVEWSLHMDGSQAGPRARRLDRTAYLELLEGARAGLA